LKLQMNLEELIHQNSSDFEVSKEIKETILSYIRSLNEIFEYDQGKNFLVRHTKNLDVIISSVYKYILRTHFKEFMPLTNSIPITIIAMGSYGREQLCVYSDIDILIVYKDVPAYNTLPMIESFLQILWDSGLKLGHRVHSIDTLFEASLSDHTIKTALLESRFICGSKYLWMSVEHSLKRIRKHDQKEFILQKMQERRESTIKYPFSMQPDIKSSPGGLRDANLLFWIAKTRFNVTKIKELPSKYITDREYKELMLSLEFLYRVRSALHLSAGKKRDKLILELIPDVASKLGLTQTKTVQKTFEAMHHIRTISRVVIKRLTHTLFFDSKNLSKLKNARIEKNHYFCRKTHLRSLHESKKPLLTLLNSLLPFCDEEHYFDISFIYSLKGASFSTLEKNELNDFLKSLFFKKRSSHLFEALYNAHQLSHILPPLRKVAYLPQFDGYHNDPVDIHSLNTLKALENITDTAVQEVFDSLTEDQKAILRLATFLHDCGKGRKKDHSRLGSAIVKRYALTLGFEEEEAQQAYTLVLHHTLMSNTAHREDIYSEKIIYSFMAKLKTPLVLKMLYVLTYADIASVSKNAFSVNNAKLLNELYKLSYEAFSNHIVLNETTKRIKKEKTLSKSSGFVILPKNLQKKILNIESNLLFLKFSPQDIIDIASWVYRLNKNYEYKIQNQTHLCIQIIRKQSVNLGYILSKLSNLNVVNMDIYKFFDGIKFFKIEFEKRVDEDELLYIEKILQEALLSGKKPKLKKLDINEKEIKINCDHSKTYAKMNIECNDQKGLIANIMTIFDDIGIDIASAKIQTIKKRARNLILIEKNGKFCTNKEIVVQRLTSKD